MLDWRDDESHLGPMRIGGVGLWRYEVDGSLME